MNMLPKMRSVLVILFTIGGLFAIVVHTKPTGSKSVAIKTPDPESLPPDTFRKLAQALYQRGDKAENRLHRKFFYNSNITCNDGTVAGYYIRRNYNSKRWIVFLEGGWICHDDLSCSERKAREHHRMSSDRWPSVKTVGGILSADPSENPHFADANHVFVPYCSSDAWSGFSSSKPDPSKGNMVFMGGHIVREVIRELADFQQLLFGRELYLSGSSAGGIGVMMNVDSVAGMVGRAGIKVRGIVDSGWFLDNDPFSTIECSAGKGKCSVIQNLQKGVRLWQARVPASCHQNFPGEVWKCFLGYKLFPFIKTPIFIFQWQFDIFQLHADNVAIPASRDQWDYIHQMGNNLRGTFNNLSAVFSPACIAHEVITKSDWTTINVEGVTLPDALQCWSQSLPDPLPDLNTDLAVRDRLGAGNEVFSSGNNRPRSVSMLADEPLTSFKTGSNLVRAIDTSDMDSTRNSISTRLQKNRDIDGNRNDRQLELKTNTRIGSSHGLGQALGKDSKRRRRQRRLKHRCRQGDDEACQKLKRFIQEQVESEVEDGQTGNEMINSDLVRSLDRRSSKRGQKLKNKTKTETEEETRRKRDRKTRKQQEKEERRRKRKEKKEKRRLMRRQKRKERREKQKKLEEEKRMKPESTGEGVDDKHHLNVRSITEQPKCQFKVIDSCSWPHCNPSCPKLKNPETGQDIDFLTLFQSFGLDMASVARALGLDLTTINNMDREHLIHLLTSQGGTD